MKQQKIGIFFCFITFSIFYFSHGSEFDFNPHQVIRQSKTLPVHLDIASQAALSDSLTYTIPTEITGNGAEGLLQSANALSIQADNLMVVLQSLLAHFNSTEGPEIEEIRNMTAQVAAFDEEYKGILTLIEQIDQTLETNAKNVTYIEKQLSCMAVSGCNVGPTSPPPPNEYNCSLATTTQTVSKANDSGQWTFSSPTVFNCSLFINSQKGLWLNINVTVSGQGSIDIIGDISGNSLNGSLSNTTMSFYDIPETQVSIVTDGPVMFTVNFVAVGVCATYDCGIGTCSVDVTNQPICHCLYCYVDGDDGKPCQKYNNKCDILQNQQMCGSADKCAQDNSTCEYYCLCDNAPPTCRPKWCPATGCSKDDENNFDTSLFWKRHDNADAIDFDEAVDAVAEVIDEEEEKADEFDPYEFIQQAQEAETSLNFTMPDTITQQDPYILLKDATDLTNTANSLMSQLQYYLNLFNNTDSAPEANELQPYINRLTNANATFTPLLEKFQDLQEKSQTINSGLSNAKVTLQCYKNAQCQTAAPTTTAPPPPVYNCATIKDGTVSAAGNSGSFSFPYIAIFNGCSFNIKSTLRYGLWINIKISNLFIGDGGSITIQDPRALKNYTVSSNATTFSNLTSDVITIYATGNLKFKLDYIAIDPCSGYNCGFGTCAAQQPNNMQECKCESCYTQDGNGKCTVRKPNPCDGFQAQLCTYGGGTCKENNDCNYYCVCPGVDQFCETKKSCDGTTTCPTSKAKKAEKEPSSSFFSKWFKFF
jgi:hypothetical protein